MAAFTKKLFESLANLSDMSQYLVVINNIQGITEQEADVLKKFAFALDKRFISIHEAFISDQNTSTLVENWKKLLGEVKDVSNETNLLKEPKNSIKIPAAPVSLNPSQPNKVKTKSAGDGLILLRDKVGLGNFDPRALVTKARGSLKNKKTLNFDDFSMLILGVQGSSSNFNQIKKQQALKLLFDEIDTEKTGEADKNQVLNSLIVMCGGSPDSKSEATFMLYDLNGDGLLSFDELLEHQTAVFNILQRVNPKKISKTGETPESIARATTESIFLEADADNDGVITLTEFQAWIKREDISEEAKEDKKAQIEITKNRKFEIMTKIKEAKKHLISESAQEDMQKLKKITGLGDIHVKDALNFFRTKNTSGFYTRKQFSETLRDLIAHYTEFHPTVEVFNSSVNRLYNSFDKDGNGVVDFSELFCGLSMLCAGNCGDKLKAACDTYDESSDGKVQFLEIVKYFQSIFSVLLSNELKSIISPKTLARVTAKDLFMKYGLDETGEISFELFKDWFDKTRVTV